MPEDIFRAVTDDEMPKVLQALKEDWPRHFVLHQLLTIAEDYRKAGTIFKNTLYIHGDYNTGVYLNWLALKLPHVNLNNLYVYTADSDVTTLRNCLLQTKLVPWKENEFWFSFIHKRFRSAIEDLFGVNGLEYTVSQNTMFLYPPEKELQVQPLPDDIYIEFLDGSHAAEMDRNWPHRSPGSDVTIKEHLEKNFGLGLFRKSDKRLLSSALSNCTGGIFVLHTDPEFRGKGYASILVQQMAKEIRARGRIPFCTIIIGNKPSEAVFRKIGFEPFTYVDYFFA